MTHRRLSEEDEIALSLAEAIKTTGAVEEYRHRVATLESELAVVKAELAESIKHRQSSGTMARIQTIESRLALAEKVVEAARARLEVWTAETYKDVKDALEAYDNPK